MTGDTESCIKESILRVLNFYGDNIFDVKLELDDNYDEDDEEYGQHFNAEIILNTSPHITNTPRSWHFSIRRLMKSGLVEFDAHEDAWTDFRDIYQWLLFDVLVDNEA